MVNVGIFYDHLENFMAIWYNLWLFGIVCGHLLYFSQFGMFGPRKIRRPCSKRAPSNPKALAMANDPRYQGFFELPKSCRAGEQTRDLLIFVYFSHPIFAFV
jgi:hypothetical protein